MALTDAQGSRTILASSQAFPITLAGTVSAGDPIGYNSGWVRADANGEYAARMIALNDGVSGDQIMAAMSAVMDGLSGGTANGNVYLSDTAGTYVESAGTLNQIVGISISATMISVDMSRITIGDVTINQLDGDLTMVTDKKIQFRDTGIFIQSGADGKITISADGTGADDINLVGAITGTGNQAITGNVAITGDFSATGHHDALEFVANTFQYPAPGTDWTPAITGATLAANKSAKKCWMPLDFLKIGDEIVSYKIVGDMHEEGGDTCTFDCKLVRVNKADPITTTDVTGGGITQVAANGNFDSEATLSAVETVATDKAYLLELAGTTSNVSTNEAIKVMVAEVTVNRKI